MKVFFSTSLVFSSKEPHTLFAESDEIYVHMFASSSGSLVQEQRPPFVREFGQWWFDNIFKARVKVQAMANLKKPITKVRAGGAWVRVGDDTLAIVVKLWKVDVVCFNISVFHDEIDKRSMVSCHK
ncbi:hypothetical protein V6N13_053294 [Hibiscus sabdariffa]